MGCLKLTYDQTFSLLKVTHSDFSAKEKKMNRFFLSEEKSSAGVYSYSFNGMEKDDEVKDNGNSYTTSFRQYDPRLGRWLSLDPVTHHEFSPYSAFDNNPIFWSDPTGADSEPNVLQSTTIGAFVGYLRENKLTTVRDIYLHVKANSSTVPRYVYTEKKGWIDMNHIFNTMENGLIPSNALEDASKYKSVRDAIFHGKGAQSYYSYEDLPSNSFGGNINFKVAFMMDEEPEGEDLYNLLEKEFSQANATTPDKAPNYKQIPASKDRGTLLEENGDVKKLTDEETATGKYVPQNFSTKPYDLENFPAAESSIEKTETKP